jgi:hypothetical protein
MRFGWCFFLTCGLLAGGCSALINPDDGRLGGGGDAGTDRTDGSMGGWDSGITLMDSGTTTDPDSGSTSCVSEEPRCEGDALVTCVSGMEIRQDCRAMSAFCDGGECKPWECEPGSRECSGDLSASIVCSARGDGSEEISCEPGVCAPDSGRCVGAVDMCTTVPPVTIGSTHMVDLCIKNDDNTHTRAPGCGAESRADGRDTVFRLEVPTTRMVTIELTDIDTSAAIDTIVYVRRVCDDGDTQVACDDDVRCDTSTAPGDLCFDGVDVRQSRINTRLEAGTYYVVIDYFDYTAGEIMFGCGEVRLSIR